MSTVNDTPRSKTAAKDQAAHERARADWAHAERGEMADALARRRAKGLRTDSRVIREAMAVLEDEAAEHRSIADHLEIWAADFDGDRAKQRAEQYAQRATDLGLLESKLQESRDTFVTSAAERLIASGGSMGSESFAQFRKAVSSAVAFDQAADQLGAMAREHRSLAAGALSVVEPAPYGGNSPHSYFRDLAAAITPTDSPFATPGVQAAHERLARHAKDVSWQMRCGTAYGRRAEAALLETVRSADVQAHKRARDAQAKIIRESRAIGTGGGTTVTAASGGAAFVPPAFIGDLFAPYLQRRPFVNAATALDLPEWGLEVYVPALSSDASVTAQTEGLAASEVDPTADYVSGSVETLAGVLTVSQQLWDRSGGPGGVSADTAYAKQLGVDLAKAQDQQALNAAIAAGGTIAYNGPFALASASGVGGLVGKIAAAKYAIRGTAGGYLEPTSVFFTPERWEYIFGWADAQGRPIVLPEATEDDPRKYGDTGLMWGGLHVWTDPNIPTSGTTSEDQIVVCDNSEVFFFRSPVPMLQAFPQADALTLQVVIRLYSYSAVVTRYANAVQTISGTGLAPVSL